MKDWYLVAETSAAKASQDFLELSYLPALAELKKITHTLDSVAVFVDYKKNLVREYMLHSEINRKAMFGWRFFSNDKKYASYREKITVVLKEIDFFKKGLEKQPLDSLTLKNRVRVIRQAQRLYKKSLGLYLLTQPEYCRDIEAYLNKAIGSLVPSSQQAAVSALATASLRPSYLEQERLDWLSKVMLAKDKERKAALARHSKKYQHIAAGAEYGILSKQYFQELYEREKNIPRFRIEKEYRSMIDKRKIILQKQDYIFKKYRFSKELMHIAKRVAELGVLRLHMRVLGWQFFSYFFPEVIEKGYLPRTHSAKNFLLLTITPEKGYECLNDTKAQDKYQNIFTQIKNKNLELGGTAVYGKGCIRGTVFVWQWKDSSPRLLQAISKDTIIVVGQTRPFLMPLLRQAKAIITDEGGLLCHAAIIARELKIPCIINTKVATQYLKQGDEIEMDMASGRIQVL